MQVGADSGGTFTDVVGTDGHILKIPSTPADPGEAVRHGIRLLAGAGAGADSVRADLLAHGTTVATNALLERKGVTVTLVTTDGFSDLIEIGRQARPSLYDQWVDRAPPLVDRSHRVEIVGRLAADGSELEPVDLVGLEDLPVDTAAVAVCLLHSDRSDVHERAVGAQLRADGWDVSLSVEVSPEFREYERISTTVINAYLRPICRPYLLDLAPVADEVAVMTSSGGLVDVETAADFPATILLSGPAGGVAAAAAVASACGYDDAVSFDMGGTSTDVCLILDGAPAPAAVRDIDGYPVRVPALDVHTVGAGGGSIAGIDDGGALTVGPRSAGAVPGPACYGLGGTSATVTDANLAAGRLGADTALAGVGRLDAGAAERALDVAGVGSDGVIAVVNASMEQAIRRVSADRGVDPAGLALVAFGGAGPLHACELADALGMAIVIVPPAAGVLSAVGLLGSPRRRELVQSWPTPLDHVGIASLVDELAAQATRLVLGTTEPGQASAGAEGVTVTTTFECRYAGQSHELRVAAIDEFHDAHRRLNGFDLPDVAVEVLAVRCAAEVAALTTVAEVLTAVASSGAASVDGPVVGPLAISRDDCAIWVPDGWVGEPGALGSLILSRDSLSRDSLTRGGLSGESLSRDRVGRGSPGRDRLRGEVRR